MNFIISPAKKMNADQDSLPWQELPRFLDRTETLCRTMQGMSAAALQKVWKCNDKIAQLNVERLQRMDLRCNLTPAILCYEGIQYQYMAPGVFTAEQFAYVQEHLRILSGFYGVLRPFDGVTPYRLEMQARLPVDGARDLYAFWGDALARSLAEETDCLVNLASKEYSAAVSRYLPDGVRFVTCIFGEEKDGKVVEKATMCKMARGEMVRFAAEQQAEQPEDLRRFDRLQFRFAPERSDENTCVFLRAAK